MQYRENPALMLKQYQESAGIQNWCCYSQPFSQGHVTHTFIALSAAGSLTSLLKPGVAFREKAEAERKHEAIELWYQVQGKPCTRAFLAIDPGYPIHRVFPALWRLGLVCWQFPLIWLPCYKVWKKNHSCERFLVYNKHCNGIYISLFLFSKF